MSAATGWAGLAKHDLIKAGRAGGGGIGNLHESSCAGDIREGYPRGRLEGGRKLRGIDVADLGV